MLISNDWIRSDLIRTKQYVHRWYKPAPFHRQIANELQSSRNENLIVTVSPQFGKTELLCRSFPPFYLGTNPNKTVITSSYNQEYVNKLSVKCADFFVEPLFQKLFGIRPHPDLWNKRERLLKDYNGGMLFTGAGSGTAGNPADLFLLDDLTKDYKDASSKAKQEALWFWYNMVVDARLQGDDSRIIIVMTRWLKNDLIGKIQKQEDDDRIAQKDRFKVLHFGALMNSATHEIADKTLLDETAQFEDGRNYKKVYSLWPEKKSVNFLMLKYKKIPAIFLTMYQGNPKDLEGCVIDPSWIKYELDPKSLGKRKFSCRGWDFGYTEQGNPTVGARVDVYEVGDDMIPLLGDVVKFKEVPSKTKLKIVEVAERDGKEVIIGVEGGGTQKAMADDVRCLEALMDYQIVEVIPKGDKVFRGMPWILKIEGGQFKFVKGPWNKMTVDEMADFSENCEEDNIEDAISVSWKTLFGGD